jgi:hypothetical protein
MQTEYKLHDEEPMFEIKDIAGLSEPIKKLIEVVAEGIGGISRPLLTRMNARAKAYEIREIAEAIVESQKLLGQITYDDGKVVIDVPSRADMLMLPESTPDQRIKARIAYQEIKKQNNIEQIIRNAAEELRDEQKVEPEKPDIDWTTRFFRIAEDITSDQMQILWGKVLAGEVKTPGSYSLRTLDLLKNITKKEAEMFVKVGQISFITGVKVFVPNYDNGKYLKEKFDLDFTDFLLLREIGLLVESDLAFHLTPGEEDTETTFICGNTCIFIKRLKETPKQTLPVIAFTEIGRQLLQLVEKKPAEPDYIKKFATHFRNEGVSIQSALIVEWINNMKFRCIDREDVSA